MGAFVGTFLIPKNSKGTPYGFENFMDMHATNILSMYDPNYTSIALFGAGTNLSKVGKTYL